MPDVIASRRSFIVSMGTLIAAPAVVRYASLMPVRKIVQASGIMPVGEHNILVWDFVAMKGRIYYYSGAGGELRFSYINDPEHAASLTTPVASVILPV